MFVFSEGFSRDAQLSPKLQPLPPVEYPVDVVDSDYIETEEFEIL